MERIFNNLYQANCMCAWKKMDMTPHLLPSTKTNPGWIIYLKMKRETMKFLYNKEGHTYDFEVCKVFLNRTKKFINPRKKGLFTLR